MNVAAPTEVALFAGAGGGVLASRWRLNPRFVEWLMFGRDHIGWTEIALRDSAPSATRKSRKPPRGHSERSEAI